MTDETPEYEPVMPFVNVVSRGGELDDVAFVCGFEVGRMDQMLQSAANLGMTPDAVFTIHALNKDQSDLVAMHHGFVCEWMATEDEAYLYVRFTKAQEIVVDVE